MSWYYIALFAGALIGFGLLWWLWITLSWMDMQDKRKVCVAMYMDAQRKKNKRAITRSGFGPNHFKAKSMRRIIEKDMDRVIKDAIIEVRRDS